MLQRLPGHLEEHPLLRIEQPRLRLDSEEIGIETFHVIQQPGIRWHIPPEL